ncbi:MAG: TonB-dependent receptor [Hymenobacteraceae bacterium]|nr:TonB-dependent receptor [Hymenobacteraceae bacterium]MDX5394783.1 TonB-dependent receptor [Hymenobacteraceae bacterium]MDX5510814.1 TonB-dependent receptor [Hymenobacteraceae bacterium]
MKIFIASVLGVLMTVQVAFGQAFSIKGKVTDKSTGEGLPGAGVQVKNNDVTTGGITDINGSFTVGNLKPGSYTVTANFIGYMPETRQVTITNQDVTISFKLGQESSTLNEVEIVADVAVERETPVAFSAIKETTLRESLANRDLPMILNETPGVYATQGSGGTGDSRINIRGFDQRNVAVMVNGVPVNDMENGWVYWSNWDLGDVTQSMQVQRGLSASKLAVPSVGGTINIITKGFDAKRGGRVRQEVGSNGFLKTSLMLSSGQLKGDWAVTVYGSRRKGDGWVDGTFDDAWSYFATVSKKVGNHKFALTGVGSPQEHGQRSFALKISDFSREKAFEFGADTANAEDRGFNFNQHWAEVDRYQVTDGDTTHNRSIVYERMNYYHKPQINLNHFWNASDRLFVSNVLYASIGNGGGVGIAGTGGASTTLKTQPNGQYDLQSVYNTNYSFINNKIDSFETQSRQFLRASVNNHRWVGFISSLDYRLNEKATLSAGIDGRDYLGVHYMKVYDLLGGDYAVDYNGSTDGDKNSDPNRKLREGDKLRYYNEGKTRWLGGYTMLEYKTNLWSAFVTGTVSGTGYQRIDYFKPKVVTLDDTTLSVGYNKEVAYNGKTYKNSDAEYVKTDWVYIPGYTVKAGANYNLNEFNNIFFNMGYLNRAQFFKYIFDEFTGDKIQNPTNEKVVSLEVGYGIRRETFKANFNSYYTMWFDRSTSTSLRDPLTEEMNYYSITGLNARHMGVELELGQEITRQLQVNAAISIGDWVWQSEDAVARVTTEAGVPSERKINVNGLHVGDAAQNQFMLGLRYEPIKDLYVRATYLMFSKYFANFDPSHPNFDPSVNSRLLDGADPLDVYRMPATRNIDLHAGYSVKAFKDIRVRLNGSVLNVLNEFYITDVRAANSVNPYDINRMEVFFNRGRTFNVGMTIDF